MNIKPSPLHTCESAGGAPDGQVSTSMMQTFSNRTKFSCRIHESTRSQGESAAHFQNSVPVVHSPTASETADMFRQGAVAARYNRCKKKKKINTSSCLRGQPAASSARLDILERSGISRVEKLEQNIAVLLNLLRKKEDNISTKNDVWIDSGANSTFIHSHHNSSTPIIHTSVQQGVTTANGSIAPIEGKGTLLVKGDFVPSFDNSLISVSQICREKNALCLFDNIGMKCFKSTLPVIKMLNEVDTYVTRNNLILGTATQRNGIYSTSMKNLKKHESF